MASIELLEIVNDATMTYGVALPLAEQLIDDMEISDDIKEALREDIPEELLQAVETAVGCTNIEISLGDIEFDPEAWYKEFKEEVLLY